MKSQTIDLLTHNIDFHGKLKKDAVSVRKMNTVLGADKALYAVMMPPVFVEEEDKLILVARHWSYDLARAGAMIGDGKTKTLVLVADRTETNRILALDELEIVMLTRLKTKPGTNNTDCSGCESAPAV